MVTKRKKKAGYFNNEEMLDLFIERNRLREIQEKTKEENLQLKKIENKIGILSSLSIKTTSICGLQRYYGRESNYCKLCRRCFGKNH